MKIFSCSACKHVAFFENSQCVRCGHTLAYLSDRGVLSAMEQETTFADSATAGDAVPRYVALDQSVAPGERYRLCRNYTAYAVCNWAIPEEDANDFCLACRLNETIPDLSNPDAFDSWQRLEVAKRRLVFTLVSLGLPLETKQNQPESGLAFSFKSDEAAGEKVLTGHCDGVVTINIKEADSPSREKTRVELGERYRTLLGHFRHESGHYYWDRLVRDSNWLEGFRTQFGNEEQDYAEAVKRHYGAPRQDWPTEFISSYATMHPWEDWAETWAHYLHMIDTLETAQSYGLVMTPWAVGGAVPENVSVDRIQFHNFDELIEAWVPLTVALNSLNRSMGLPDVYPFVLAERVIEKLRFVHQVVEYAISQPRTRTDQAGVQGTMAVRAPGADAVVPDGSDSSSRAEVEAAISPTTSTPAGSNAASPA